MRLGNIQFYQVREILGYDLSLDDFEIWKKYHNNDANLNGMDSSFHVFAIPLCIVFKGEGAKNAILKMFKPEKIIESVGEFMVYEQQESIEVFGPGEDGNYPGGPNETKNQ